MLVIKLITTHVSIFYKEHHGEKYILKIIAGKRLHQQSVIKVKSTLCRILHIKYL